MAAMQPTRDGYLSDAQGRLVPIELVKPEHLLEDDLVRTIYAEAVEVSDQLRRFRERADAHMLAFMDLLAEKHGVKRGGLRGNVKFTTYDGTQRVQVSINDQLELGPELQFAKELFLNCLGRWTEGSPVEVKALVMSAFDVGKKGKLDINRILSLRRLDIRDPEWLQALDIVEESKRVTSSKSYLRVYSRSKEDDQKFTQVPLDLASV